MTSLTHSSSPLLILPAAIEIPRLTSVKRNTTFNYFGPVFSPLVSRAAYFLFSNTDAPDEALLAATLQTFLQTSHADCAGTAVEKSCCWFTIRVTRPHCAFNVPRWHQDGRMYAYDEGREDVIRSKYALTLLGPQTLLLPAEDIVFTSLKKAEEDFLWWRGKADVHTTQEERNEAHEALRGWLAERFRDVERVTIDKRQIVRFSWGRPESPVHSEPRIGSDRVFMTVLFGSERELRSMCEIRGTEFGLFNGLQESTC